MSKRWSPASLGLSVLVAGGLLCPQLASACGGVFCDGGTVMPMPVDQTGEDILFVRDGEEIEVHIRIQYQGQAERFAWLLPLPAVPEVSIGAETLFNALSRQLAPNWWTEVTLEDPPPNDCPPSGCLDLDGGGGGGGPSVVFEEIIGAYEVVVLQAGTVAEVFAFFDANQYAYDPAVAPLLQSYIDGGSLITALKLTAAASVDEIHPLVFRFVGDEPCIPIRLTSVAARDDMGIRAYFLGEHRWAPSNYEHITLNPLHYDWILPGSARYFELLSLAVDEAGGHAFVTEYAGSSDIITRSRVWPPGWTAAPLYTMDAHMAIDKLIEIGLIVDDMIHPQVLAALREFLPIPQDWAAPEYLFWIQHQQNAGLIDAIMFDAVGFATRLDERLFWPAQDAVELLDAWPTLTRLQTTMSPEEMTLDPTFHENPDLGDIEEERRADALVLSGGNWASVDVPESPGANPVRHSICVARNEDWPALPELPFALTIEQIPQMGPPQVSVDHRAEVWTWAETAYAQSTCFADAGGTGTETGDTWGPIDEDTDGDPPTATDGASSCACSSPDPGSTPLGLGLSSLLLLALAGIRRSRRAG